MAIFFDCSCGQKLSCPDGFEGRNVKCPKCQNIATVPSQGAAAGASSAAQEQAPQRFGDPLPPQQQPLPPPLTQDPAPGEQKATCPFCRAQIASTARKCPYCREWIGGPAPGMPPSSLPGMPPPMDAQRTVELEGARKNATIALVCSIVSLFCCGILAIVGIVLGYSSRKVFDRYSETDGRGNASAAIVIGWIVIGLSVVTAIVYVLLIIANVATHS